MKKHIIIAGITRGGKTTICNAISNRTNYNHVCLDPIVRGFQKNFPEVGITHSDTIVRVSRKFAPFINTMIEDALVSTNPLLLDTYHIVPKDYIEFINKERCDIYFVGYPEVEPKKRLEEMRMYDKRNENIILTDDELLAVCKKKIDESKYIKEECEKYGLPFIDTSFNRNEVIEKFVSKICK